MESYPTSLVKSIVQYSSANPNIPALKWGREHEVDARHYVTLMKNYHNNLQVHSSGLVINLLYPYLGASPDGMVSCECCVDGLIEIKCPYKYRNEIPTLNAALSDPGYFLNP